MVEQDASADAPGPSLRRSFADRIEGPAAVSSTTPDASADAPAPAFGPVHRHPWSAGSGPEAGLATPSEDGGIDLTVSTQWLHNDRDQIAECLGLPPEKVRLTLGGVGGAFGGREDVSLQIHASLLAQRSGRPVKMVYSREESFLGHVHRHPGRIWMRHSADETGRIISYEARIVLDGGAYRSSSFHVVANAAVRTPSPSTLAFGVL